MALKCVYKWPGIDITWKAALMQFAVFSWSECTVQSA